MFLNAGTHLGAYEVVALLGAGGMGEVYRARDTRLKREVAIKVLPDAFAHDTDRLSRFQREAELLAILNHPNIASVYGLEQADGVRALVLELVEGDTLAERIARGPIPLDEALPIARQIADALEAAHERGVIHRDLKPANIKITPGGTVKVLDFGLAKVRDGAGGHAALSNSPTMMSASMPGAIMGTAAYMSPEQAKGREADRTTDVWAFGCVLYEMLTGRAAFEGETLGEILGSVFKAEPDWSRLPAETPSGIRRLLKRCLRKDSTFRLRDIADARLEIHDVQNEPAAERDIAPDPSRRKERFVWASVVVLLAATAMAAIGWTLRPAPAAPELRFEITTPPTDAPTSFDISPDGQKIVFVSAAGGKAQLWMRSLDSVSEQPLAGTEGATYPFWSPDSLSVGFFADGNLKRIDIDGGAVKILANAAKGLGGAWSHDGTVLFSRNRALPISRVSASGGESSELTRIVAPQQASHSFPQFLPDGRHILYHVFGTPEGEGVYIADLDGSSPRKLLDTETAAVYAPSGQLLSVRQGTLFAQNFDLARLELIGNPYPVAVDVAVDENHAAVSVSATGMLVYRKGLPSGRRQLEWVDRSGKKLGSVGDVDSGGPTNPSMSFDGRQVAVHRFVNGNVDVWLLELGRGLLRRLTFDAGLDITPSWSPDGRRVAFTSNRKGALDLYWTPANGAGTEELLLATPHAKITEDWSPDGRVLLYRSRDAKMGLDLWALPLDGERKPFPVTQTDFNEKDGQFSPDGKWIAYQSDESGRFEIYLQPFAGPGGKSQISNNGGAQVRWRRDGKELFYIGLDSRLMAAPIRLDSKAMSVEAGAPVPLFVTRVGDVVLGGDRQQYVVSADGQRFLMNTVVEEAASPLTVILNWRPKP